MQMELSFCNSIIMKPALDRLLSPSSPTRQQKDVLTYRMILLQDMNLRPRGAN